MIGSISEAIIYDLNDQIRTLYTMEIHPQKEKEHGVGKQQFWWVKRERRMWST